MFAMLVQCFLSALRGVRDAGTVAFVGVTERLVMFAMLVRCFLSALRDVRGAGAVAFVSVTRCSRCWCSGFCQCYEMFAMLLQCVLSALPRCSRFRLCSGFCQRYRDVRDAG